MQRVMIIGPCGAGKSTLGFDLAQRTGLPLFHMDKLAWQPGWIDSSIDEVRERLLPIVAQDCWIIEGHYGGTLAERLERADTVLYLDYPIRICLARLLRRIWRWRGQSRPDMTEGCPERLDLPFLWYVARWNRGPRLRTEQRIAPFADRIVRLRSPAETARWLAEI
ncbi:MAG: topology modulation protein [Erythrobacter sp.]|nr:topology modulation protein [Erythrobacter sp.]